MTGTDDSAVHFPADASFFRRWRMQLFAGAWAAFFVYRWLVHGGMPWPAIGAVVIVLGMSLVAAKHTRKFDTVEFADDRMRLMRAGVVVEEAAAGALTRGSSKSTVACVMWKEDGKERSAILYGSSFRPDTFSRLCARLAAFLPAGLPRAPGV